MAKLFTVQLRRSICRNVLYILLWVLTIINKCTPNQDMCMTNNRRNIAYIQTGMAELTWSTAWERCNHLKSFLPVICDKFEQDALISSLNSHGGYSSVWIAGKKTNFTAWTWIDGHPFISREIISSEHDHSSFTHVALDQNLNFKTQDPQYKIYYLCQYSGFSCNSEDAINLTKGCVRTSGDDHQTWFNARNQCIKNGSDLAILIDADLVNLRRSNKLSNDRSYWIGLRKNAWHWIWQQTVSAGDPGEEMKYSNWSNRASLLYGDCISVDASTGDWMAVRCTETKRAVCQANRPAVETTSSTSSTIPPKTPIISSESSSTTKKPTVTISDTILSTTTCVASNGPALESAGNNTTIAESYVLLYSGVGGGIVFVIICIIVIILVVRHNKKSNKDISESKIKKNSGHDKLDLSPNKQTPSPASPSANAQVAVANDTQGVYAEISPATLNQPGLKSKIEQPGIVYASLDFQHEPVSMEPDKKSARATGATK
jgi:hypothetical protein